MELLIRLFSIDDLNALKNRPRVDVGLFKFRKTSVPQNAIRMTDKTMCSLRLCFDSISSLLTHKRHYCKLRFTCKCEEDPLEQLEDIPGMLQCSSCGQDFSDPWDLMEHVQDVHTLNIYQLCDDNQNVATLQ